MKGRVPLLVRGFFYALFSRIQSLFYLFLHNLLLVNSTPHNYSYFVYLLTTFILFYNNYAIVVNGRAKY